LSYPNVEEITLVIQLLDKNSSIYSFWRIIDYNLYTLNIQSTLKFLLQLQLYSWMATHLLYTSL